MVKHVVADVRVKVSVELVRFGFKNHVSSLVINRPWGAITARWQYWSWMKS